MKKIVTILLILFISFAHAQKEIRKANNSFENFDFKKAIEYYSKAVEKEESLSQNDLMQFANSYFNVNDYKNAKVWYEKLYKAKLQTLDETTFLKYVNSLRSNRDYDTSVDVIKEYYKDDNQKLSFYANQIKLFDSIKTLETVKSIRNLKMNTKYSEFGVVKFMDKVVFSSTRDTINYKEKLYSWNYQPFLNLYTGEVNLSNGEITQIKTLIDNKKSSYHIGSVCFTEDNQYVFYARNNIKKNQKTLANKEGMVNLKIIKGTVENGEIVKEEILEFNSDDYSCAQPNISDDGKFLFFVSDMPGGYGATDIYVAEIFDDGTINTPINLGETINTPGREMFPYMYENTLYFSSDGYIGFGGLDIFKAEKISKNKFDTVINLGDNFNSNMDDFAFMFFNEANSGYLSSNRMSGKGDDDIFFFELKEVKKTQFLSGLILLENTTTPIADANIRVLNLFDEVISEHTSNENGEYSIELDNSNEYVIEFTKPGYSVKRLSYTTDDEIGKEVKQDVYLSKFDDLVKEENGVSKIIVEPIYFDYDKWDITPKAIVELNKVLKVMNDFPDVRIKIESHTDSRGNDEYNLLLSDKRAKSTQAYLISQGVEESRILSAIGYGESQLINECKNGVKCSEEEHSLNRRSDFIIVDE